VTKEDEKKWERVGCVQPTLARPGTLDCPVAHRTVSGAPGWPTLNRLLSGIDGVVRLEITGLSGGAPDCPVSHPRRTRRSREMKKVTWLKFTGLSGGASDCPVSQLRQRQRSSARSACDTWLAPTVGWAHRTVRCAPDCVRCANQPRRATVGCA
jgi:hypothetical protein